MKKALFIDRDGTLLVEPKPSLQIDSLEKLEFLPGVFRNLYRLRSFSDYELVIVSNQDGMGTQSFPYEDFIKPHSFFLKAFENEGIVFNDVLIDPSLPEENKPTRKPGTGMFGKYLDGSYDLASSYVIGDRLSDLQLARNLGAKGILFGEQTRSSELVNAELIETCVFISNDWQAITDMILQPSRTSHVVRTTSETDIEIQLGLDSPEGSAIDTGLGFFDHLLDQISRHGRFKLEVKVKGDLHVDEHHTIEDTAIALGEAFLKALGNKRGINRYGFLLPMDDCLARVAVDFGGRSWLVWGADFKREKIGDVPTEMFMHFFKSFADGARCNLNIHADGSNEHHKIEAIFKAFARALRMAVNREKNDFSLPSTKGLI